MSLKGFSQFCSDFGLFPDILSKKKMVKFHGTLAAFDKEEFNKEYIDEHLFVEALALTAFEVTYKQPQPSNLQKVLLLMEKMSHSEGPTKVKMAYGVPYSSGI